MAGVLPLGTGGGPSAKAAFFWSLKGKDLAAWHDAGLDVWKRDVLALWPESFSAIVGSRIQCAISEST
jgi:hypothetical protein